MSVTYPEIKIFTNDKLVGIISHYTDLRNTGFPFHNMVDEFDIMDEDGNIFRFELDASIWFIQDDFGNIGPVSCEVKKKLWEIYNKFKKGKDNG